jgi:hypothetical protein
MGWTIERSCFDSRYRQEIFLYSTAPRPALGPTQPPIQPVQGAFLRGWSWLVPPSSAEVKNAWSHTSSSPSVVYMSDYRRGLDWWMDLLTIYTYDSELQAITAPPANVHNSQLTTAHAMLFPSYCVFTSRSLATVSNGGDFSASGAKVLSSQTPVHNWLVQRREKLTNTFKCR